MRKSLDLLYARDKFVNAHLRMTDMCRRAIEDLDTMIHHVMEGEAKELRARLPVTDEIPERRVLKMNYGYAQTHDRVILSSPHLPNWTVDTTPAKAEREMLESLQKYFNKNNNHQAVVFTPIESTENMFMSLNTRPVVPQYLLVELYYRALPGDPEYVISPADEEPAA